MDCCHLHFCTNDYHFFFEWIFVIYISVRMTTFSFWMDFRHVHFCTYDYHFFLSGLSSFTFLYGWLLSHLEWIVVMHISVRMTTISFRMDCRHARFCANDYHFFSNGLSSCMFLCEWLQFFFRMDFRHAHFCANDFPYSIGFSICAMLFNAWIARCSDEL